MGDLDVRDLIRNLARNVGEPPNLIDALGSLATVVSQDLSYTSHLKDGNCMVSLIPQQEHFNGMSRGQSSLGCCCMGMS